HLLYRHRPAGRSRLSLRLSMTCDSPNPNGRAHWTGGTGCWMAIPQFPYISLTVSLFPFSFSTLSFLSILQYSSSIRTNYKNHYQSISCPPSFAGSTTLSTSLVLAIPPSPPPRPPRNLQTPPTPRLLPNVQQEFSPMTRQSPFPSNSA